MRYLIASLVAVSLSASACSSDVAQTEEIAQSDDTSTAATSLVTSSAAESTKARVPDDIALDDSWRFSSGSLVRNCPSRLADDYGQGPVEIPEPSIFNPVTGDLVEIEPPLVPAGAELLEAGCLPSGTEEAPGVSIRMYLRTPSKGLDPESFKSLVYTYTLSSPEDPVVATLDYPAGAKALQGFMAGTGGNLLYRPGDGALKLIKPDGTLVREIEDSHRVEYVDEHVFVTSDQQLQTGHDGATGAPLEFASGEGKFYGTWFGGFAFSKTFGVPSQTQVTVVDTTARRAYDASDLASPLVWAPYAVTTMPNLKVVNLETGETVLERDAEQTRGLGITNLRLSNKYLYVENDEDSPVIDLTTGEQVSSGWGRRPTEPVTSKWMVVAPFEPQDPMVECFFERAIPAGTGGMYSLRDHFKCRQGGTLVFSPEGYKGPLF